jgi:hypothetical protein
MQRSGIREEGVTPHLADTRVQAKAPRIALSLHPGYGFQYFFVVLKYLVASLQQHS